VTDSPPKKKRRWWWLLPLGLFALLVLLNPRYSAAEVGQDDGTVVRAERFAFGPFGWVASTRIDATGDKVLVDVRTE
jgi:hypothetical protein